MDLTKIVTAHKTFMEHTFAYTGKVRPMGILFVRRHPKSGELLPEPAAVPILGDKEGLAEGMREIAARGDAIAAVLMVEAWISAIEKPSDLERVALEGAAAQPNREERLVLTVETRSGTETWSTKIVRDEAGVGVLGEWELWPGTATGRMVGFLPKQPASFS